MALFDKILIFNIDPYKILNINNKMLNLSDIVTIRDGRRCSGQGLKWPMSVWNDAHQWGIQMRVTMNFQFIIIQMSKIEQIC